MHLCSVNSTKLHQLLVFCDMMLVSFLCVPVKKNLISFGFDQELVFCFSETEKNI